MRDFQTKTNLGGVPDSNTATKMGGGEATSLRTENKTAVSRSGQTLAPQDGTAEKTDQLAKALFINGVAGQSMVDGGSAGVYQLTPITGTAGLAIPDSYDNLSGAIFEFEVSNVNPGASTLDIGQTVGTLLGAKELTLTGGVALSGGEMAGTVRVIFDLANDRFEIIDLNAATLGGISSALYALLASPAFTGTPTAPTAAPGTDTTQIATTAFIKQATLGAKPFVLDHGSKSGAFGIDLALAELHIIEFSASATLTISSTKTNDKAVVIIKNGGFVITIAGIDNDSPTLTEAVSTQDFLGITKSFGKITCVSVNSNQPTS